MTRRRATIQGGRERVPTGGSESRVRRNAGRQADVIDLGPGLTIDARGRLGIARARNVRPAVVSIDVPVLEAPAADTAVLASAVSDLQDVVRAQAVAILTLQSKLNETLTALRAARHMED